MIPFTQYVMPDGRKRIEYITRPEEIESMAREVIKQGYVFEIEMLGDMQSISMEVVKSGDEDAGNIAGEICVNGPKVLEAVDKLVMDAFNFLNQPKLTKS